MNRFLHIIDRIMYFFETLFLCGGLLVMTVALFMQFIAMRVGASIPWAGKLAAYMMMWVTFAGAVAATREKSHISIEIISGRLKGKAKRALDIVVGIVCIIVCVYGIKISADYVSNSKMIGQKVWELGIPLWIVHAALPVALGFMALRFALAILIPPEEDEGGEPWLS